ncbi:LPXTG cell wall anchor domain-containing protein [Aeromicrobium sp. 179-A 4D2 NHS]|uniref:LPXTG cell wall anchor domain-containing protein n=1 Tax=Aeromicrobium sp. 179-A 4D2 NHS TaxID=3142375 RepID=UPI00399F0FC5
MGAMIVLALSGPASSEGYGDPVIVPEDGGTTEVQPGEPFEVAFTSNVECSWTASFVDQTAPASVGFDYAATFDAPTAAGTYTGTVECRYSTSGPFRPVAFSQDELSAATRDQTTTQTFTVVVAGDAADDDATNDDDAAADDEASGDDSAAGADNASTSNGALADTGGDNWQLLALGAGLVVVGGGVAIAARRRKTA